jgi:hypothetical protein
MPFLIARPEEPQAPASRVEGDVLLLGRGTNAGLRLDDEAVALEHARIEQDPAGFKLSDLGSDTGTYLNGKPVEEATYLKDGDTIGIGGSRLRVRLPSGSDLLGLEVRPVAAEEEVAGAAPAVKAPQVDYAGAYTLRRPFLTKGSLALLLTLVAAAALIVLPLTGALRAFQPGPISERHQRAKNGGPAGCLDCHTPWKGPAATSCKSCHERKEHQEREVFSPACADCHFEHRGKSRLTLVSDKSCVACHGNLQVKGGGELAYARSVQSFPDHHADFSVTLFAGQRLPVAEAVARRADPGTVRLNHSVHLKPIVSNGPQKFEILSCESCHQPGQGPTGLIKVSFKAHCNRCHKLTFDDRRPDEEAVHGEPREVYSGLVTVYQLNLGEMGSLRERRRAIVRNGGAGLGLDVSAGVTSQVQQAENHVYRSACAKCHPVNLDARPNPTVERARMQSEWLPLSGFDHRKHTETEIRGLTCETCHTRARTSTVTADVLVPGIEVCGGCHGGGKPPGEAIVRAGPKSCRECHRYHPPSIAAPSKGA